MIRKVMLWKTHFCEVRMQEKSGWTDDEFIAKAAICMGWSQMMFLSAEMCS